MTDEPLELPWDDPTTVPFWEGARRGELRVQRCAACGAHQLPPRPFCVACEGDDVEWVTASGRGTVHSMTTVHLQVRADLEPPYVVALVELDEGPRLLGHVSGEGCAIGARVAVEWVEREGLPPIHRFAIA